jgi:hypothetical protein
MQEADQLILSQRESEARMLTPTALPLMNS